MPTRTMRHKKLFARTVNCQADNNGEEKSAMTQYTQCSSIIVHYDLVLWIAKNEPPVMGNILSYQLSIIAHQERLETPR